MTLAFLTGLIGSLHCAAMCGPLAIAGCARGRLDTAGYFLGRLAGYAAVGALFGFVGEHALCMLPVASAQTVALVLVGLFAAYKGIAALIPPRQRPVRLGRKRTPLAARLLGRLPRRGLTLGVATALLPCGMLVPAWTLAASAGGPLEGAAVMAAFWAGTFPGLVVPLFAARLVPRIPAGLRAASWCALALWIAARPLLAGVHHH